jgi:2-oxoglutarate ferredoxin oxidoreductase subunit delta
MKFWRVPLDADEIQTSKGIVYIIEDRCKGCGYCIEFCPQQVLEFSSQFNKKGYHLPSVKKPEDCLNCHYCEIICPEFAIYSVEVSCENGSEVRSQKSEIGSQRSEDRSQRSETTENKN